VQVHGYLASPDAAEVERVYGHRFAAIRPIAGLDDEAAFRVILADDLDLLVDLCGHAHRQRMRLLARRPAPALATCLESFYSTGLPTIDYLLSDLSHSPPQTRQRFTEAVLRLTRTRLCYTPPRAPDVGRLPARSRGHVTFGSFNHLVKVNRQVVSAWSAILRAMPGSRLILKWSSFADAGVRERVARRFRDLGITADRLELRDASGHFDMMAEYNEVDIALDPFPHNGGLTTCEALWMGVPVLCLRGEQIVSRQSSSIWQAVGLTTFIADDLPGYVSLAVSWARDHNRLEEVRANLRPLMASSPLCDAVGFTRDLEGAYRFMTGRCP
jgi:predicted O-linked N-acetylglucosamine transferase (SPINDLY family)